MIFLIAFVFLLGLAFGSFLNVVVDRMVIHEKITGRSYCDHCRKILTPLDLMPVVSYLILGGKCRYCKRKISLQYPAVELLTGIVFAAVFYFQVNGGQVNFLNIFYLLLVSFLMVVTFVFDYKYQLIPTTLVFGVSLFSLFYNFFTLNSALFVEHVLAAFLAATFFGAIVLLTRGRGMGSGDIVLAFLIGMVLGLKPMILAVFLAFLLGSVVALVLVTIGRKRFRQTIAFGPFLVVGFYLSLFWYPQIIDWYVALLS